MKEIRRFLEYEWEKFNLGKNRKFLIDIGEPNLGCSSSFNPLRDFNFSLKVSCNL